MNSIRYLHLIVGLAALLSGLYFSVPFFSQNGLIDLSAISAMLLGLVNIQQFSNNARTRSPIRNTLSILGSVLLLLGALVPLVTLLANPAAGTLLTLAVGISVAGVCLFAVLSLTGMLPRPARAHRTNDSAREMGTVKWFNTSKGFGFISRDQGEDVFVHFRAIRGEGHRVLLEGQRVEFVVAHREKGLQAEDVEPLD
ncbi:cold-shock DNA-binding protein family [Halopseudomonas litoralis]|uniref:Cold-shock DNA-binding protein family n=1 Tax=Halopseudomonas litoralis TaxID=797277 RepID=A0A1H1MG09_9GAMM|nr:cold-shock protein [Halopseudomonas litoralis]SDR85771.1 cold-shock DNA-binding protein family [Halopseudomonas litoralis]